MKWNVAEVLPREFEYFAKLETEGTILDRFSYIVSKYGERIAISNFGREISYRSLDRASNSLAFEIVGRLGSSPEPVALLYRAGAEHCAAQFAVLKAGKFFASLDSELDTKRLISIVQNLSVRLILCSAEYIRTAYELAETLPACIVINAESGDSDGLDAPPAAEVSADSYAYVVYTSGSTGSPQGVVISHRCLLHFVMNHTNTTHLRMLDRALQVCHLSGAASAGEVFPTLLTGGTLFPFPLKSSGAHGLPTFMRDNRISVCTFVPAVFRVFLSSLPEGVILNDVRLIRLSGDRAVRQDCIDFTRHFSSNCLLRTSLGASEAMLYTQFFVHCDHIPEQEILPAGYPLPDMEVYVVDDALNHLGPNEPGEIAVRSRYLSPGYWRNDSLTAKRFLASGLQDGIKTYLTRDFGFLKRDGCIVHVGRKDSRVKIHGKLVTLTDIESHLLSKEGVRQAVVVGIDSSDIDRFLTVFYVTDGPHGPTPLQVREYLRQQFPTEIVPRKILWLDAIPLTHRNKIDRRRLASNLIQFEQQSIADLQGSPRAVTSKMA